MDVDYVVKAAQIASLLEVSGHPKPGNVHRNRDFEDMVFEDFLISGVVIGDIIAKAALQGESLRESSNLSSLALGKLILEAVEETNKWVLTNTNLGIIMLFIPLSAAAGMSTNLSELQKNVGKIMAQTTPEDAVNLYKAIYLADAGGMGEREDLDVNSKDSEQELLDKNVNLFQVLDISAQWDLLARELTTAMPITFDYGYPVFKSIRKDYGINSATVQTFLTILSHFPDSLISRKYGLTISQEVSKEAQQILDQGGILTNPGRFRLKKFDEYLAHHNINPGTTADLTASSIMVALLENINQYHLQF